MSNWGFINVGEYGAGFFINETNSLQAVSEAKNISRINPVAKNERIGMDTKPNIKCRI